MCVYVCVHKYIYMGNDGVRKFKNYQQGNY